MKKHPIPSSFVINPMTINILTFENEMRTILHLTGQNIWFSDGVIDILGRITTNDSLAAVKEKGTLFKHQIKEKYSVPFMTYVPTTGVDERQIFCLSSTRREYVKERIGKFMHFFKQYHSCEDIFPKEVTFLVSPYVRRYHKGEITSICAYFEEGNNSWNFFERTHPLELEAGSIYFSDAPIIPTRRKESLREFILRKTIDRKEFS